MHKKVKVGFFWRWKKIQKTKAALNCWSCPEITFPGGPMDRQPDGQHPRVTSTVLPCKARLKIHFPQKRNKWHCAVCCTTSKPVICPKKSATNLMHTCPRCAKSSGWISCFRINIVRNRAAKCVQCPCLPLFSASAFSQSCGPAWVFIANSVSTPAHLCFWKSDFSPSSTAKPTCVCQKQTSRCSAQLWKLWKINDRREHVKLLCWFKRTIPDAWPSGWFVAITLWRQKRKWRKVIDRKFA